MGMDQYKRLAVKPVTASEFTSGDLSGVLQGFMRRIRKSSCKFCEKA
jgi:hypothetical protein